MSFKKSARLNQIYERLKNSSGVSFDDLAREFEVSKKTIARDFKALQDLGAYKNGQLLCLDKKKAKDNLKSDERVVLGILDKLARASGTSFYLKAKPLLTRLTQQLNQPIFINSQSESLDESDLVHFDFIERLILQRLKLNFEYKGKSYEVKPLKLACFDGFWYVLALDSKDNDCFKKFYFKQMGNLKALNENFKLDERLEKRLQKAHSVWFNFNETFTVRLLISQKISRYFKRWDLKWAMLYPQSDESVILELEISHIMEIKPLIYEFIPHIKVLEPTWLNEMLKNELLEFVREL